MTKWLKNIFGGKDIQGSEDSQPPAREEDVLRKELSPEEKSDIEKAVKRTIEEYGETLKRLGNE